MFAFSDICYVLSSTDKKMRVYLCHLPKYLMNLRFEVCSNPINSNKTCFT